VRARKAKLQERKLELRPWSWYAVSQAMSKAPITYTPVPDATPEAELDTLTTVYCFILFESCSANKRATGPTPPDTGKDERNVFQRKEADMT
jgi:hypothetical protein